MTGKNRKQLPAVKSDADSASDITRLFLRDGMGIDEEISRAYNLSGEFAHSRKNRSYPVFIAIVLFSILLMSVTFALTYGIQRDIDRITVDIEDFKDLNLAELLGALNKAQTELKNVDQKIALSRQSLEMEVMRIRRAADLEMKKIENSGLGDAAKQRVEKETRDKYNRKIASTRSGYEERIRLNEKEAAEARSKITMLEKKVAGDKADYKKSADLKVQTSIKDAELKLAAQEREHTAVMAEYEKQLTAARSDVAREISNAHSMEQLLTLYKRALTYYAKTRGEHGYVIDPGTDGNMFVDVNPYISIKKGDRAYVLNQESKILALVELKPDGIRLKAKIITRMISGDIQPFDKILLIKN